MVHGTIRHHGYRTTVAPSGMSSMTVSVVETWCSRCRKWVQTDGVMGPLRFEAEHDHEGRYGDPVEAQS